MTLKVRVPSSKSMTQRGLILAALADQPVAIRSPLECDDTRYLTIVLQKLGAEVTWSSDRVDVRPSGLQGHGQLLHCGNAGTAMRFASCLSLVAEGGFILDGDARMRERPIGPLGRALVDLGIDVSYLGRDGCPPLSLERRSSPPSAVTLDASISSQYVSGLAMVAPILEQGLTIAMTSSPVSRPYIDMTVEMMRRAGAAVTWRSEVELVIEPGPYSFSFEEGAIDIEPDWSAAGFIIAASIVTGSDLEIEGLEPASSSLQGDRVMETFARRLREGDQDAFDLTDAPDLIAPLAAAALFSPGVTKIRGAAHTRVKESDRIAVLARGIEKIGAAVVEHDDGLDISRLERLPASALELDPASDHRMAMAFGVISLVVPQITVRDPECVTKSFPDFWEVLKAMRSHLSGQVRGDHGA